MQRAEVLGAQANAITPFAVAGRVVFEAVRRTGEPVEVRGGGLPVVAVLGMAVSPDSAVLLAWARGGSLNMHRALEQMAVDAARSVAAVAAGVGVVVWDAGWVDPAFSIAITVLVLWSASGLLRATAHVLLEGTGDRLDVLLEQRFGISHATLELECHVCENPDGGHATMDSTRAGR